MAAFLVLLVAALSRFFPHTLHSVGLNFTAVGAGLLFFGSRRPRWQAAIAAALMAVTDIVLTTKVYNTPFHVQEYAATWLWYAAAALVGSTLLRKVSVLRVAAGVFTSATTFFLLTNFTSWLQYRDTYARDINGLMQSYDAGLPFYGNDLLSTAIFAGVFFGLPVAAVKLVEAVRAAQHNNQPLT
jgi:hypothetical protein